MMRLRATDNNSDNRQQWRPLVLFCLYRISVASLFLVISTLISPGFLTEHNPSLFILISVLYTLLAIASLIFTLLKWPAFGLQVLLQVSIDIAAITCLMHLSGGVTSGIGMLLIAVIATASLLMPGRSALLFAAMATLAVLAEATYAHLYNIFEKLAYTQAGLLGAAMFATALLAMALARRARESQALAEERGLDLANLAQLNDQIVNRMQSGILVVDDEGMIKLINKSARNLLGVTQTLETPSLQRYSQDLHGLFRTWCRLRDTKGSQSHTGMLPRADHRELRIRFVRVGARKEDQGSILYVDDNADISRQVQATKLASLGRLTASIAHEIRNPLGAISHAAQLLNESPDLNSMDSRLVNIINDHTGRLNRVIENVLGLSRKASSNTENIHLQPWLERFTAEFGRVHKLENEWCRLRIEPYDTHIRMDPNHLHQVMWNLCTNACKYASGAGTTHKTGIQVLFMGGVAPDTCSRYLDIIDSGPGIGQKEQTQLFEPFFTTSDDGTGLGLYISRELCRNNDGDLSYMETSADGCCFRIHFPQPEQTRESDSMIPAMTQTC